MGPKIFVLLIVLCSVASVPPCPESCSCRLVNERLHAECASLEVVRKLQPKQMRSLEALSVRHASLTEIDPKIKALRNLLYLDLSHNNIASLKGFPYLQNLAHLNLSANRIKGFSPADLPQTLVTLDVSENFIRDVPEDWIYLPNLREVDLHGNPVECGCASVAVRNNLEKNEVAVTSNVKCKEPEEFRGKYWDSPDICPIPPKNNLWDDMLGDGPEDGSGSGDIEDVVLTQNGAVLVDDNIESEFIPQLGNPRVYVNEEKDEPFEGSGDFGERPRACHINCSTPPPIEDKNDTENVVGVIEAVQILTEDVMLARGESPISSSTDRAVVIISQEVTPPTIEVTKFSEDMRANVQVYEEQAKESNSTYILLAVLCALVLMLVLYALMKNKKSRENRRRRNGFDDDIEKKSAQAMTELKPLNKQSPENANNIPEKVPLMNGQNGTSNGKVEDFESPDDLQNRSADDHEYVELRKKHDDGLLTPEAKRVTIKAGEIPESIPRTPLLVNRHISSDGNVITTPSSDQRL